MRLAGGASFRLMDTHMRIYAHVFILAGKATADLASVPFDRSTFESTLRDAGWAAEARARTANSHSNGRGRRTARGGDS